MQYSVERINEILRRAGGSRYLEIGVFEGGTFLEVEALLKVAVDPSFQFDHSAHAGDGMFFYETSSDEFFTVFDTTPAAARARGEDGVPRFDVVFIDGLHTFEQSYRDFIHSLRYAHERTVWILDDTVPNDPYSALTDGDRCYKYRKLAGIPSKAWHGDVYKTVVAIHDNHKEFFYRTIIDMGNPQTVLWRAPGFVSNRESLYRNLAEIDAMDYMAMAENAQALMIGTGKNFADVLYTPTESPLTNEDATAVFFYEGVQCLDEATILKAENARLKRRLEILQKEIDRLSRPAGQPD